METQNEMSQILKAPSVSMTVRIVILLAAGAYLVYAFLLTRQIKLMNRSFSTPQHAFFRFIGHLHFFSALFLTFLSLLNLL